jgi:hypothetical protein
MSVMPIKSLHFTNGHPVHADLVQSVLDFAQSGPLNNGFDFLHVLPRVSLIHSAVPAPGGTTVVKQRRCQPGQRPGDSLQSAMDTGFLRC